MGAQGAGVDRSTRLTWALANTIGFGAGGATAGAIARTMGQPHYGVVVSTADALLIVTRIAGVACAIFGIVVGTSQWLVLRRTLERVAWWVPGTAAGWAAAGVFAGLMSAFIGGTVTGIGNDAGVLGFVVAAVVGIVALGFLPVTFQWMVLRRRVPNARRWLVGPPGRSSSRRSSPGSWSDSAWWGSDGSVRRTSPPRCHGYRSASSRARSTGPRPA